MTWEPRIGELVEVNAGDRSMWCTVFMTKPDADGLVVEDADGARHIVTTDRCTPMYASPAWDPIEMGA